MEITFNPNGNAKQYEAAVAWNDNTIESIVYGGSKGSGKSFVGASMLCGDALLYPGTLYFIARKELNDLRKYTLSTVVEVLEAYGVGPQYYKWNGQDNYFTFYNGSKIFFIECKFLPSDAEYMRFGSAQFTRGMIEEAGEIDLEGRNALHATVGRWKNDVYGINGKLIETCNPAKNYLYRIYKDDRDGLLAPNTKFIQALPTDNKKLPPGYIEKLARILSPSQKKRLLFGQWEQDDDPNALLEYDHILDMFENDLAFEPQGKTYLTADIARFGSDKAIILVWRGWTVIDFKVFEKSATTEIQDAINDFRAMYKIDRKHAIADQDGVGGGVVDNCKIKGFTNNARPAEVSVGIKRIQPKYKNLQDQCGYGLAAMITDKKVYWQKDPGPKYREEITEELEQLKRDNEHGDNLLRLMPKSVVKKNIGRSPDWRDALLMRYYFEVYKTRTGGRVL